MTIFLIIYCSLMFSFSVLSLIRHDYWIFRVCEYPRWQKVLMTAGALILLVVFYDPEKVIYTVMIVTMAANLVYLIYLVWPYTFLGKKQMIAPGTHLPEQKVSIMIANVLMTNKDATGCLREIKKTSPDVILLVEANEWWAEQTASLHAEYPFRVSVPLENTYGLILYSKLELADPEVKYLVEKEVPSIHARLMLRNGHAVQLVAVHPIPPIPTESTRSTERDREMLLVADIARASAIPVIVIGDLNDVAWSYTTKLFLKISGLLDPRRGRGFYNTFNARNPIFRFPLDHAFASADFKIISLRRLHNFHSDHFPIFISLQYEPGAQRQQEQLVPDEKEQRLAQQKKMQ